MSSLELRNIPTHILLITFFHVESIILLTEKFQPFIFWFKTLFTIRGGLDIDEYIDKTESLIRALSVTNPHLGNLLEEYIQGVKITTIEFSKWGNFTLPQTY